MLLLIAGILLIVLLFFGAQLQLRTAFAVPSFSSSSPTAPSTNTCSGCHSGVATTGGGVVVTFPSGITTYTPGGQPIQVTVKVTDPTSTNTAFGYLLTARLASSVSSPAGTYTLTDANSMTSGMDVKVAAFGSSTWSFDWTPPATASGTV